jgi:hypothetical protein
LLAEEVDALSDLVGELARVREAFGRPTLRKLDRKWAPLVLAVFKIVFTRDQRSIAAERLHTQVDTFLDELRSIGETTPPVTSVLVRVSQLTSVRGIDLASLSAGPGGHRR